MTGWVVVLVGAAATFALKLAGYLVPRSWLAHPRLAGVTRLLPAALLAALVVVQTVRGNGRLALDARVVAVAVAAGLLLARAPFIVVVVAAALAAAGVRALGWG